MKRALARKWAKALESGDYTQTTGELRNERGFCCLGVLCNLHAEAHPEIAAKQTDPYHYLDQENTLPQEVMDWSGMGSAHGNLKDSIIMTYQDGDEREANSLIDLNDELELDFKAIAKVIRKHWKDL